MGEDGGKMCEKRKDGWYCVSFDDYRVDGFDNAIPAEEYGKLDNK